VNLRVDLLLGEIADKHPDFSAVSSAEPSTERRICGQDPRGLGAD